MCCEKHRDTVNSCCYKTISKGTRIWKTNKLWFLHVSSVHLQVSQHFSYTCTCICKNAVRLKPLKAALAASAATAAIGPFYDLAPPTQAMATKENDML